MTTANWLCVLSLGPKTSVVCFLTTHVVHCHVDSSVIYIDNPVGTGFSYVNDNGTVTSQDQVVTHLTKFLEVTLAPQQYWAFIAEIVLLGIL